MSEKDSESVTQAPSHAEYLLRRVVEEARRALGEADPRERAKILAELVQPYAGWALREAVLDCREAGLSWAQIAPEIGLSQAVLSRQARGVGPVVTIAPAYGDSSRNADAQTPLRLAATSLVHRTLALVASHPDTPTARHLYIAVMAMAQAQATNEAEPLLRTAQEVLRITDETAQDRPGPDAADEERAVWDALAALRYTYEDRGAIRVAAELNALPKTGGKR